jgi:ATP adenylyltransferase
MLKNAQFEVHERFTEDEFFNEILFESKNFKVIPSLGSLIEGWLLVLPKSHFISIGAIDNSHLYNELEELVDRTCKIVENEYGNYVMFEHGPAQAETIVGCGVDYAHLHIVPIKIDLVQESSKFITNCHWDRISSLSCTSDFHKRDLPYLLVQDNSKTLFIGSAEEIPSQTFRKVIAEHLGVPNKYDWKQYPFYSNITKTIAKFSPYRTNISLTKELQHE